MAILDVYTTHVGLVLRLESDGVVLDNVGDASVPAKVLFPKPGEVYSNAGARAVFDATKAHYEERKAEEVTS